MAAFFTALFAKFFRIYVLELRATALAKVVLERMLLEGEEKKSSLAQNLATSKKSTILI